MQPLAPQGYGIPNQQPGNAPAFVSAPAAAGEVSERTVQLLHQTKPWVIFLSVLGFLGSGIMLLASVGMFLVGAFLPTNGNAPFPMGLLGLVYLPLAAFYVYPAKKLWGYGSAISRLSLSRSSADLETAIAEQKSFWKFVGIAVVVMFGLYLLLFVGMAVFGAAAAAAASHAH